MSSSGDRESSKDSEMERNKQEASSTNPEKEKEQQVEGGGNDAEGNAANSDSPAPEPSTAARVPFTSLSQVDSDMALARALQEQVIPQSNLHKISRSFSSHIFTSGLEFDCGVLSALEKRCQPLPLSEVSLTEQSN